ncbi:hypothetical protein FRC07_001329, partial [Ceratobasidium sp. 392]
MSKGSRLPPNSFDSDQSTPPRKERRHRITFDSQPSASQEQSWKTEMRRGLRRAIDNPTFIEDYSFAEHQARADVRLPKATEPGWRQGQPVHLDRNKPT